MILVTVGSADYDFSRLVRAADELCAGREGFVQTGRSHYRPRHAEWTRYCEHEELERLYERARVLISHAGAGTVIDARRHGLPLVVVPRRAHLGEHFNDHQVELCRRLEGSRGFFVVYDIEQLDDAVRRALAFKGPVARPGAERARLVRFLSKVVQETSER